MEDTYYVTSECVTTEIVPMDDNPGMNSQTDGGQIQFDIIETVFQVRSKPNDESLSPEDLNEMIQKPDQNLFGNTTETSKTSALPQISGDPGDKNSNEPDLSQKMPMTPSKNTSSSPKTSGDDGADENSKFKKGGHYEMLMHIDRDFDTNVGISENGNKIVTKDCKEIVSCFKVINEAEVTEDDKPTIVIDRHQTEKTVTFADQTQETLILRKEIITYPHNLSSGDDAPTKEHIDPFSPTKSPGHVSRTPNCVTADDSFVQSSDPKNLDSIKKNPRPGTDVAPKVHGEIVTIWTSEFLVELSDETSVPHKTKTELEKPNKGMKEVVIIETFDVEVELAEHPELIENLGPKTGEIPDLRHGVHNSNTKKELQEFVTIETTEVVVEVEEFQPSSSNWFGNLAPKKGAISNAKSESDPMGQSNSSGNLGSKRNEKPKVKIPNTLETLTVDVSEYVVQKIQ